MLFKGTNYYIGIDIGTQAIKIVQLKKKGSITRITHAITIPTPQEAFEGEKLVNPELISTLLKKTARENRLSPHATIGAVPEKEVINRKIRVPVMPDSELKASLQWEVEKYIPIPGKDLIFDYVTYATNVGAHGKEMDLMIIALPRKTAYSYSKLLIDAGFQVLALDTIPYALFRSHIPEKNPDIDEIPNFFGCLDIGASGTNVIFYKDDLPVFSHNVPIGGVHLASDDSATTMQEFGKEIKRCLNYMKIRWKGENCSLLYLSGGGALHPGLPELMARQLDKRVLLSNPADSLKGILDPKTSPDVLSKLSPAFSAAIGLALREVVS